MHEFKKFFFQISGSPDSFGISCLNFSCKIYIMKISNGGLFVLLGCSGSRGMRQTFSCLSKLGGTTNLLRLINLTILDSFFRDNSAKNYRSDLSKGAKDASR